MQLKRNMVTRGILVLLATISSTLARRIKLKKIDEWISKMYYIYTAEY